MPETTETTEIDALLKTATPEAANALQEIVSKSDSKETTKAAKRALYLLSQRGIAPTETALAAPSAALKSAAPENVRFLMSNIDGFGNQMIWFVLPDKDGGRPLMFSVLVSDEEGIKDYIAQKIAPAAIEGFITEYSERMNAFFVDADSDYGRWLVARAQALNRENRKPTPPGFLPHAERLGPPQRQYDAPPRDGLPTDEEIEADESFPRDAAALFAKPVFEAWFLGMDVIIPELAGYMKTIAEKTEDSPNEIQFKRNEMIQRVIENVVTPGATARFVERLQLSAYVLWKKGDETTAKQALYHARKLQADPAQSDFASALAQRTLEAAREMFLSAMRDRDAE